MWILPPILVGAAAILFAPQHKRGPQMEPATERAVAVRATKVSKPTVVPRQIKHLAVWPSATQMIRRVPCGCRPRGTP